MYGNNMGCAHMKPIYIWELVWVMPILKWPTHRNNVDGCPWQQHVAGSISIDMDVHELFMNDHQS